tara:strand:+ start:19745 stop:20566 length:822 start_codon:yes stop_codon:yes gene_type:complete
MPAHKSVQARTRYKVSALGVIAGLAVAGNIWLLSERVTTKGGGQLPEAVGKAKQKATKREIAYRKNPVPKIGQNRNADFTALKPRATSLANNHERRTAQLRGTSTIGAWPTFGYLNAVQTALKPAANNSFGLHFALATLYLHSKTIMLAAKTFIGREGTTTDEKQSIQAHITGLSLLTDLKSVPVNGWLVTSMPGLNKGTATDRSGTVTKATATRRSGTVTFWSKPNVSYRVMARGYVILRQCAMDPTYPMQDTASLLHSDLENICAEFQAVK